MHNDHNEHEQKTIDLATNWYQLIQWAFSCNEHRVAVERRSPPLASIITYFVEMANANTPFGQQLNEGDFISPDGSAYPPKRI